MDSDIAKKRWIAENSVSDSASSDLDEIYKWDPEEQRRIQDEKPWTRDPNYFKR